jgi:hypothetical protein
MFSCLCQRICEIYVQWCLSPVFFFKKNHVRFCKMLAWCVAIVQSLLIVSSRKHYSVDVVVAWLVNVYLTGWLCYVFSPLLMYLPCVGIRWIWWSFLWIRSLQVGKNVRQYWSNVLVCSYIYHQHLISSCRTSWSIGGVHINTSSECKG